MCPHRHAHRRGSDFLSSRAVTVDSGIQGLVPGAEIDDYVFEPCGYSMNGIEVWQGIYVLCDMGPGEWICGTHCCGPCDARQADEACGSAAGELPPPPLQHTPSTVRGMTSLLPRCSRAVPIPQDEIHSTIHITPEDGFSYASFELCGHDPASVDVAEVIARTAAIFQVGEVGGTTRSSAQPACSCCAGGIGLLCCRQRLR